MIYQYRYRLRKRILDWHQNWKTMYNKSHYKQIETTPDAGSATMVLFSYTYTNLIFTNLNI